MTRKKTHPPLTKVVYIPSRGRPQNVQKIVPRWLAQEYSVILVLEKQDCDEYIKQFSKQWNIVRQQVKILRLPESNKGIGFARNYAVAHADGRWKSFIMADDDVMPKVLVKSDGKNHVGPRFAHQMMRLQKCVEMLSIVGCAAVHSYQDFLLQGFLKAEINGPSSSSPGSSSSPTLYNGAVGRPVLAPNGSFGQCYAINTQRAVELGGFDGRLTVGYEDNDFMMRSIAHGYPWAFHSGVWMDRLGGRFEKGGIADLTNMPDKEKNVKDSNDLSAMASQKYLNALVECRITMRKKWPDYTSDPYGKKFRISWRKLLDGQIPNWRSLSALHGGGLLETMT